MTSLSTFWRISKLVILATGCLSLAISVIGCGEVKEMEAYIYGMESWVFGYPLVMMDVTREVLTAAPAPNSDGTAAPINQLAKMPHYVSPDFKNVVRISLNSLWTTGWVDLEKDAIVLSVPDTKDRYYVFSLMNMWTDVFGSIGKRTTGTGPGNFLIVGPNWKGTAPPDVKQTFRSPTRYAWLLGQTQVNGPDDFATVNALQAQYKLTPLSAWGKPYTPPDNVPVDPKVDLKVIPPDQVARMDAGTFFNRLAIAMKDNPPYADDKPALEKLKKLGIEPGKPFDIAKVDPKVAAGLAKAVKEVQIKMAEEITKTKNVKGWINLTNLGLLRHRLQHTGGRRLHGARCQHEGRHGLSHSVLRRRRQAARQRQQVRPAIREGRAAADERHLVRVAVQRQLLRAERSQPLCDRPLDAPQVQRGRLARDLPAGRIAGAGQGVELAAHSAGAVQSHAPQLFPEGSGVGWQLPGATGQKGAVSQFPHRRMAKREMVTRRILAVVGAGEAFTGLALVISPSLVVRLLFGAEISGVGTVMSRIAGIALIALGVACWPGPPRVGMLIYSAAVALYLAYIGFAGGLTGIFLWPAVILHVILTALLTWAAIRDKETKT